MVYCDTGNYCWPITYAVLQISQRFKKYLKKASLDRIDQRFVYFIGSTEEIALATIYQLNCFHLFTFINAF